MTEERVHLVVSAGDSRPDVLAALGRALHFPGWYGRNLDALEECLRGLPNPTTLVWSGPLDDRIRAVLEARASAPDLPRFDVQQD